MTRAEFSTLKSNNKYEYCGIPEFHDGYAIINISESEIPNLMFDCYFDSEIEADYFCREHGYQLVSYVMFET